jgi:hypothetical protein
MGNFRLGSQTWTTHPAGKHSGWRYGGLGWPRRLTAIRPWIVAVWVICGFTIWGYVDVGPRGRIDGADVDAHKTDFTVFTEAGAAFFDGRNPYLVANPRGWHYLYPPIFALMVAPLSLFDTESQVTFWYFVNVGLTFGCFFEARKILKRISGHAAHAFSRWVCICGALAAVLPFLDCMQAGQLGIAILYLLLVGFRLFAQASSWPVSWLAGLIVSLPAAVKLVPALPVAFLVFQQWSAVAFPTGAPRPWGRATSLTAGVLAGLFLFLVAIPASMIGWHANLGYLRLWEQRIVSNDHVGGTANFNFHSERNQSLSNAAYLLAKSSDRSKPRVASERALRERLERLVKPRVRVVIGASLALLLGLGLTLGRRKNALDQATAFSAALCATLLVSPLSWGHYYMALGPAVVCAPLWLFSRGMPRAARVVAVIPAVLSWSHYVAIPYTGAVGLLGLGTTAWFLGACGLIVAVELFSAGAQAPQPILAAAANTPKMRMRRRTLRPSRAIAGLATIGLLVAGAAPARAAWKAAAARVVITPSEPMWMSGYAARTRPSDGVVHDLWAKALALEDPLGRRAVIVTLDLCGIGRDISNPVRDQLKTRNGLDRDRIVLACSHTHSGPVAGANLLTMYNIDEAEHTKIAAYARFLEAAIVRVAGQALDHLAEAQLSWGAGRCDFAVNRRANKETDVPELRHRLALQGPVDHDVPVLRVARADGSLLAIVFGYACHCTVLDGSKFCGDYAGFAQVEIESHHPSAQAMFVAACGADQNPIPRRTLELAARYGKELASSVEAVLSGALQTITGPLGSSYEEIPLAFAALPAKTQIERDAASANFYVASRARHLLATIASQGALDPTYPYPVLAWRLDGLEWIFLGGEVVVDYALRIKRNLGSSHTWVSAYCNDVMAYIPSKRVLQEGGYEGGGAMLYYGLPASWSDEVEEALIAAVARGTGAASRGIPPVTSPHEQPGR